MTSLKSVATCLDHSRFSVQYLLCSQVPLLLDFVCVVDISPFGLVAPVAPLDVFRGWTAFEHIEVFLPGDRFFHFFFNWIDTDMTVLFATSLRFD